MFLTFAFVIGLMIWASRIATKYVKSGTVGIRESKFMKVIDTIAVGQDRYILIVQVNSSYYLVSSTADNVSILQQLDGDDIEQKLSELKSPKEDIKNFSDALIERLKKK